MKPLISVIIPVYNVEQYLNCCMQSVFEQTYENLEIILVDDGSTDSSGKMCDEYGSKDSRVKVIHKENGGLSSARNAALDIFSGELITFIDSDDYVESDYIAYLYHLICRENADISMCQLKKVYTETDQLDSTIEKIEKFSNVEAIECYLYQKKFSASAHCKMYKKWIFDGIRYPVGYYYEDMAIICKILDRVTNVAVSNQQKYYYVQRGDSIMGETFNLKKMHRIEIAEQIHQFVESNYPMMIEAANARCFLAAIQTYREIPLLKKQESQITLIWSEIKKYRKSVIKDKKAKKSHRIMAISSYGGKRFLKKLGDLYSIIQ